MTPVWVADLAAEFWRTAGPPPPFPRDLLDAAHANRVNVVGRPGLRLAGVRAYLQRLGLPAAAEIPDRPLRACLYAHRGRAFVFLDAADPPDEQRFSLAHELAHFLRDVDAPRRAADRVGPAAVEVLDGRPATAAERLSAVLRGVSLAAHVHLLHRDDDGVPLCPAERDAERAADRLGCELLAPAELFDGQPADVVLARLVWECGLPPTVAADYARALRPPVWRDPLLGRLGIPG